MSAASRDMVIVIVRPGAHSSGWIDQEITFTMEGKMAITPFLALKEVKEFYAFEFSSA